MKGLGFGLVFLILAGCSPTGVSPMEATASKADDPMTEAFREGKDVTEWMMNTKHTLRGFDPETSNRLLQKLLEAGAAEMRVADVQPDSSDPAFKSGGALIIKMPISKKDRASLIDFLNQAAPSETLREDSGQNYVELAIAKVKL